MVERRREPRVASGLKIQVWGIDAQGTRFAQSALARNISGQGALLSGVEQALRAGDLVGIRYGERRARFRVVWTRKSESENGVQAAVQRLEEDACPWKEELGCEETRAVPEMANAAGGS
jgi:hypothetical protein